MDYQQIHAFWASEENERLDRLIAYFRELLDGIPDNPDPESDEAIERQLLLNRISTLDASRPPLAQAPVVNESHVDHVGRLSSLEVEGTMWGGIPQTGVTPPSARATQPAKETVNGYCKARIVVIDDHEVVRRGLISLLESRPGWKVVGEAGNGEEAIAVVKLHQPDIALMNVIMPGRFNGLEATRRIMRDMPDMRVLIHSMCVLNNSCVRFWKWEHAGS
jgi:CheY-like chemotaxis protein